MKRIIIYAALLSCALIGCKKGQKFSQAGIYKLVKQTVSGGGTDSTYKRTQIKIYTVHWLWCRVLQRRHRQQDY